MNSSIKREDARTLVAGSRRMAWVGILVPLLGAVGGFAYWGSTPSGNVLTDRLLEPLNGARMAKVEINSGTGHLTVQRLAAGEQALASGTLQYFQKQGLPTRTVNVSNGRATLALSAGSGSTGQSWFRLPWTACVGAYEWQIQLNPNVQSDITARSNGGNVNLNLAGMAITHLSADSGGGNMSVVLPDNAANLSVDAKTGAGNVTIEIGSGTTGSNIVEAGSGAGNVVVLVPSGLSATVHATSGLGKVIVDPRFSKTDKNTYCSPDYDTATNKVEIIAKTGAGNVTISTK